jgi:LacI family transcriptional regulator
VYNLRNPNAQTIAHRTRNEANSVNIKQFANELGVSPTTISRALSGRGRVSARTRDMIRNRVAELGYTPNLQAQRLVTGRAYTIALDWSGTPDQSVAQDFFLAQLVEGIQAALQRRGYGLLLCGPHLPDFVQRWVSGRAVDGVIFVGDNDEETVAAEITGYSVKSEEGAPCVVISHHEVPGMPDVRTVVLNLETGIQEVVNALAANGHQRVAFVGSRPEDDGLPLFARYMAEQGLVLPDSHIFIAGRTVEDGARALRHLMRLETPPTAIFARTDLLAVGVIRAAHHLGIRIPEQLSVIGHDDIRVAELMEPPLTTVRIDYNLLGEQAAETMFHLIETPEEHLPTSVVCTHLVLRETLAPASVGPLPGLRR